ncbi:hypothetical protein [Ferrovibrio sp.]|uniref:hypothetical protein n=1 Tax=Ferrovibrio sp. TaxID=1917215 RepID=UPI003D2A36A3
MDDKADGPSDAKPDAGALAKRFLDLWQEQASLIATDPKLAELSGMWMAMWHKMGQVGLHGGGPVPSPNPAANGPAAGPKPGNTPDSAPGAASAAAAPGHGQPDLAELTRRLAECEKRLGALESRAKPAPRRAPRKPKTSAAGAVPGRPAAGGDE